MISWVLEQIVFWFLGAIISLTMGVLALAVGDIGLARGSGALSNFFKLFFDPAHAAANMSIFFRAMYAIAAVIVIVNFIIGIYRIFFNNDQNTPPPFKLAFNSCKALILSMCSVPIMNFILNFLGAIYRGFVSNGTLASALFGNIVTTNLDNFSSMSPGELGEHLATDAFALAPGAIPGAGAIAFSKVIQALLALVIMVLLLVQIWKYIINLTMRYALLGVLYIFAPVLLAFGGNPSTESISKNFIHTFIAQGVMIIITQFFLVVISSAVFNLATGSVLDGGGVISNALLLTAIVKIGNEIDQYAQKLGIGSLSPGGGVTGELGAGAATGAALSRNTLGQGGVLGFAQGYSMARDMGFSRRQSMGAAALANHDGKGIQGLGVTGLAARAVSSGKGVNAAELTKAATQINAQRHQQRSDEPLARRNLNNALRTAAKKDVDTPDATADERFSSSIAKELAGPDGSGKDSDWKVQSLEAADDGSTLAHFSNTNENSPYYGNQVDARIGANGSVIPSSVRVTGNDSLQTMGFFQSQQSAESYLKNQANGTSTVVRNPTSTDPNTGEVIQKPSYDIYTKTASGVVKTASDVQLTHNSQTGTSMFTSTETDSNGQVSRVTHGTTALNSEGQYVLNTNPSSNAFFSNENASAGLNVSNVPAENQAFVDDFKGGNKTVAASGIAAIENKNGESYHFGILNDTEYNNIRLSSSPDDRQFLADNVKIVGENPNGSRMVAVKSEAIWNKKDYARIFQSQGNNVTSSNDSSRRTTYHTSVPR